MRDITYGEIKTWLTRHEDGKLISTLSDGLGFLAVLTVVGFGASPALIGFTADLLAIKTELTNVATRVLSWFGDEKQPSPSERVQRMRVAYGLLACSAFFEAVERRMPNVMKVFQVDKRDRTYLVNATLERIREKQGRETKELSGDLWNQPLLPFPHPADNWDQQQRELSEVYEALAVGLAAFLPGLAYWDELNDTAKQDLLNECEQIPKEALRCFETQYTVLATDCYEFRVWAHRQEYISGQRRLDSGMQQLERTIRSQYDLARHQESEDILATLRSRYVARVSKPILREREFSDDLPHGVTLPTKTAAFIPQNFKVIRYEPGDLIGSEELWSRLSVREDLPDFLWSYIHSPYSELHPLVILGHPGSGKSLLTEIFAARLSESPFTPIRILLRDTNADARIREQIDEQLGKDTESSANWSRLRHSLSAHPAVLIFDGYDELLQASGQVFANYIVDVQEFQHDEKDRSQSGIRTIVTSRATLIEKARIPRGATVLRLLPFNEAQRNKWVESWNSLNSSGFREHGITPLTIPANRAVRELAEQPLLLLMLAIYDSYGNQLKEQKDLGRASLYSNLVSLFIHRECNKDQVFRDLPDDEQEAMVLQQRKRLGICALGMFNREKLSITHQELQEDLVQFGLPSLQSMPNRKLGEADSLFGSFFFIYQSQAKETTGLSNSVQRVAYEFLHNTFGEYLCAEYLVRRVLELMSELATTKTSPSLATHRVRLLSDPSILRNDWYGCWISTPLSTRPVIVEMIREIARSKGYSETEVPSTQFEDISEFDTLIHNHLGCILGGRTIPVAMLDFQPSSREPLPIVSRIAVYSLNLVVVNCALRADGYYLAYDQLSKYLGKQDPWDRIASLWLAAMPDGSRWSISGLLDIRRANEGVHLQLREPFDTSIAGKPAKAMKALALLSIEEMWAEAERMNHMILGSLTHQLASHMSGLLLLTENLVTEEATRGGDKFQELYMGVKRTMEFVGTMGNLSNLLIDRDVDAKVGPTPLGEVIMPVIEMLSLKAKKAHVRIECSFPHEVTILVDNRLVRQALINIVDNAIQASHSGSVVHVTAHAREQGRVEILVQDQGTGISELHRSRIFQPGYSTKPSGSGLGLYISKRVIESLRGTIQLMSTFEGGTTFSIVLPSA
jgi:signal transduction histidine kinase